MKAESEGVLLEYASSCGLLEKVTGIPDLIQTFRGRRTTPKFSFDISASQITATSSSHCKSPAKADNAGGKGTS